MIHDDHKQLIGIKGATFIGMDKNSEIKQIIKTTPKDFEKVNGVLKHRLPDEGKND